MIFKILFEHNYLHIIFLHFIRTRTQFKCVLLCLPVLWAQFQSILLLYYVNETRPDILLEIVLLFKSVPIIRWIYVKIEVNFVLFCAIHLSKAYTLYVVVKLTVLYNNKWILIVSTKILERNYKIFDNTDLLLVMHDNNKTFSAFFDFFPSFWFFRKRRWDYFLKITS